MKDAPRKGLFGFSAAAPKKYLRDEPSKAEHLTRVRVAQAIAGAGAGAYRGTHLGAQAGGPQTSHFGYISSVRASAPPRPGPDFMRGAVRASRMFMPRFSR